MHKYCLDTSGLSNPIIQLPEDVHVSLWEIVTEKIKFGVFCWNVEIADELACIPGPVGECLKSCKGTCCYDVGGRNWDWLSYLETVRLWKKKYHQYISEYNGGRKDTIGVNDLSIVALAKTLELPVVSMERPNTGPVSGKRLRIPDLCKSEGVEHLTFNGFLQAEGIII